MKSLKNRHLGKKKDPVVSQSSTSSTSNSNEDALKTATGTSTKKKTSQSQGSSTTSTSTSTTLVNRPRPAQPPPAGPSGQASRPTTTNVGTHVQQTIQPPPAPNQASEPATSSATKPKPSLILPGKAPESLKQKKGGSSSGSSHRSIGNLIILEDRDNIPLEIKNYPDIHKLQMMDKSDIRYNIIVYCIHLALSMLEHEVGRNAIVENVDKFITECEVLKGSPDPKVQKNGKHRVPLPHNKKSFRALVDDWLVGLRNDFPVICFTKMIPPVYHGTTGKLGGITYQGMEYNSSSAVIFIHGLVSTLVYYYYPT